MRFIVANYGTRHLSMLLAHLFSVARSHPEARQTVYWQDIPERFVSALRQTFPHADWVKTEFNFDRDPLQRISSKVLCWARAAEEHAHETELVFCDSDTLVRRELGEFFYTGTEDVIFTTKPEKVPLNSGVLLARGGERATAFFRAWREATLAILRTPEEFAQANDGKLPYGGTDQMSLYQLLAYTPERTAYALTLPGEGGGAREVRLRAEPCARLNETNSRPLHGAGDEIRVIHYKAGWQRILLDGRPFSRFRPRAASWEMFTYFVETINAALQRVNETTRQSFTAADFGLLNFWYYRQGRFFAPGYLAWRLREASKRAWLKVTGRLKPGM